MADPTAPPTLRIAGVLNVATDWGAPCSTPPFSVTPQAPRPLLQQLQLLQRELLRRRTGMSSNVVAETIRGSSSSTLMLVSN